MILKRYMNSRECTEYAPILERIAIAIILYLKLTSKMGLLRGLIWMLLWGCFQVSYYANASGIVVHLTIASRTIPFLPQDIKPADNLSALFAGAFHPDCFYNCLGLHLVSEEAHWPPFLAVAVHYYNTKYGVFSTNDSTLDKEKSSTHYEDGKRLKAFLYGVFSHQIADISWHSLYFKQGLLAMLAVTEFDGSTGTAHSFLDTAGDFLMLSKLLRNLDYDGKMEVLKTFKLGWDVPTEDLINIYQMMGYDLSADKVEFCMATGYSALRAELSTSTGLSLYYSSQSPVLDYELDDYYLGGLGEILTTIQVCMDNFNKWFETGDIDQDPWDLCSIYYKHSFEEGEKDEKKPINTNKENVILFANEGEYYPENEKLEKIERNNLNVSPAQTDDAPIFITSYVSNARFGCSIASHYINDELYLAVGAEHEEITGSVYMIPMGDIIGGKVNSVASSFSVDQLRIRAGSIVEYPYRFGNKIIEWKVNQDSTYLVISKPGKSEILIYSQGVAILTIRDFRASSNLGSAGTKEMGLVFHVHDVDNDGFSDLIIGSYYSDEGSYSQHGNVIVLSGLKLQQLLFAKGFSQKSGEPNRISADFYSGNEYIINIQQLTSKEYKLPYIFQRISHHYEQFGKVISTSENFTFIGVTSLGSVLIYDKLSAEYLARVTYSGDIIRLEDENWKDINRVKSKDTELFGYDFVHTGRHPNTGMEWVLVSARSTTYDGCLMCGSIHLYLLNNNDESNELISLISEIRCDPKLTFGEQINFGYSAVTDMDDSNIVYVSALNYEDHGAVFTVNIARIIDSYLEEPVYKVIYLKEKNVIIQGNENEGFTKFGKALEIVKYKDNTKYLIVGMPFAGYRLLEQDMKLFGKIGIYRID